MYYCIMFEMTDNKCGIFCMANANYASDNLPFVVSEAKRAARMFPATHYKVCDIHNERFYPVVQLDYIVKGLEEKLK